VSATGVAPATLSKDIDEFFGKMLGEEPPLVQLDGPSSPLTSSSQRKGKRRALDLDEDLFNDPGDTHMSDEDGESSVSQRAGRLLLAMLGPTPRRY